ncbi:HET-domain-containing protein, partial [Setomelanomma holmii]
PPYEALSYVWGPRNEATDVKIACNGETVTIRGELEAALVRLRLSDTARIMWADALCINQNDNDEKSHQVPLMGSIFSRAGRVIVWLGQGHPLLIAETIRIVRYIGRACKRFDEDRDRQSDSYQNYRKLHLPVEILTPPVCIGLQKLFNRSWFNRVWCVQEIRLAKDAIVYWGDQEVAWSDIGLTAWWIRDHNRTSLNPYEGWDLLDPIYCTSCVTMYDAGMMKIPLLDVLQLYVYWNATDPRDQVYGLLNLVDDEEANAIHLDYNKGVGEVYSDTVTSGIRLHSRLTAFAHISHPPEYVVEEDIPSWAPQWARSTWPATPFEWPRQHYIWSACNREPVKNIGDEHISHKQLRLTGVRYGTVSDVFTILDRTWFVPTSVRDAHPHSFRLACAACSKHCHEKRKLTRTLVSGWLANQRYDLEPDVDRMDAYYLAFTTMMSDIAAQTSHQPVPDRPLAQNIAAGMYQADTYMFCRFRRCFRLANGSFGLGPQCMRKGDVVVVLYGGDTPYVLRPTEKGMGEEGRYWMMGQAYVDELMDGGLMREVVEG